ncbi:MAG TPA: DNA polymerase I, partial [Thermoleophilia bacterium]|nr:DNA polymerase I [Thermoleophilia bacterium]
AQRPHMPEPLSAQWPLLPELMEGFGVLNLVRPGYEADDILGTLAEEAKRQGVRSVVVTGDRDAMQIVDDDIWVMSTGRGVTDVKIYTPAAVLERFGVTPAQIPDYIGLKGDSSDNIPGVPGIGEKTAAQLLQQFGSIDELYRRLDEVRSDKRRALLAEHEDAARLSLQLATMVTDVPLEHDLVEVVTSCGYRLPVDQVDAVFERFEFRNLRRRLKEITEAAGAPPEAPAAVSGSLVRLAAEPDVGPVAALLEKGEAALAFEPRDGGEDGLVVAAHAGGDACLVAPADAVRAGSLWLLSAHVVVHDAKAQPGFVSAPVGPGFDTAVAAYLLMPERPEKERTLFALAGADDGAQLVEGPAAEAAAATAATLTWRVAEAQRPRLVELGLERLFREVELPLVRVLAQMEAAGVKMDPYRLGEITARVRDRIDEITDAIYHEAGGTFTIGSPQQLADVLFVRLELEASKKGKTGFSTDARVLRGLRDKHAIVPLVEEWRELTKLLNTYLEPLPARLDPVTGRLHTTFNQLVAATGRLSSSNPNLQNIPVRTDLGQEIRACFVAEEGHKLLVADYSQIELRLMASLSRETALLEAYHRGEDVHRVTAAAVAGIPVEEVTKRQRERAKATNFGIMYGLSAFGLSEQVDIPRDEAQAFIDAYFAKYPKVKEFRERVIAQAAQDGYVTTLFGRRRAVPELRSSNFRNRSLGERLAVNTILQGTAADIIKVAMVTVSRELERRSLRSRLVLQVHDELVLECPDDELDVCAPLLRDAMCGALELDPPLEVDVGSGDDWVAAKA